MQELFEDIIGETPKDVKKFVEKAMDIVDQIFAILENKKLSQRDLAKLLGKRESEISKWLSGTHNLTLETISKIEAALDEDIIITPLYLNEYEGMFCQKKNSFTVEHKPNNLREYKFSYADAEINILDEFANSSKITESGKVISIGHYQMSTYSEGYFDSLELESNG